jgi:hypothetical protein
LERDFARGKEWIIHVEGVRFAFHLHRCRSHPPKVRQSHVDTK